MYTVMGSRTLEIPVLPEKLAVTSDGDNQTETVLGLGEVNLLHPKKLRGLGWDGLLTASPSPLVTARTLLAPIEYIKAWQAARDAQAPLQFVITGIDLDINTKMAVESINYETRGGEPGDLYYTIQLKEWKDTAPKRIALTAGGKAVAATKSRVGAPTQTNQHRIKAGDSLWSLAQRHYGDGSQFTKIFAANQSELDKKTAATGDPRYSVYTGQVLKIP